MKTTLKYGPSTASESSVYYQIMNRKRSWTPVAVDRGPIAQGSENAIFKALALRCLEIPVKEFLQQGLEKELPKTPGVIDILKSNQNDEDKHDLAFQYIVKAHGVDERAEREAQVILKAWMDDPSHPIQKAAVAERSVFFVLLPFYRFNGDYGMKTTSADISRDEQTHVTSHYMICKELGLTPSNSLNKLRKATVAWVMESLEQKVENNQWQSKQFWLDQSDSLYYRGKAEGLVATRRSRMPAFFEAANSNLPSYG
jgi:hypothetical protein